MVVRETVKLTIYVGDSSRHGHKPLYRAVVELLHHEGIAGATVLHGIEGYGADKQIHTMHILELSADLPVVIITIDSRQKIEAVIPELDALIDKGLVTIEPVDVVFHRPLAT